MVAVTNFDNPKVVVATKVRESYKTDKYLGGLIKITRLIHVEKMSQRVDIYLPADLKFDEFYINGVEVAPKENN
jgi:hypothetical protein